ncbi:MAG TPA: glutaredoxin domain-containing protein [Acidimicrobiales bacterium]|nr:glutaredoxin domain-containing protein [Acidimicrobiales bacterium]
MTTLRVLGTSWCGDCARSKTFLDKNQVDYQWVDIELDEGAAREVESLNDGHRVVPTIIFPDGDVLVEPSNAELAAKLSITL